jgi:hypothetical protein
LRSNAQYFRIFHHISGDTPEKFTNRTFQSLNLFFIPVISGHLAFEAKTSTPSQNVVQQTPFDSTKYLRRMKVSIYHVLIGSILSYGKVVEK